MRPEGQHFRTVHSVQLTHVRFPATRAAILRPHRYVGEASGAANAGSTERGDQMWWSFDAGLIHWIAVDTELWNCAQMKPHGNNESYWSSVWNPKTDRALVDEFIPWYGCPDIILGSSFTHQLCATPHCITRAVRQSLFPFLVWRWVRRGFASPPPHPLPYAGRYSTYTTSKH